MTCNNESNFKGGHRYFKLNSKKFIIKKEKACLFKKWDQDSMELGYCLRSIDEQKETTSTRCREN